MLAEHPTICVCMCVCVCKIDAVPFIKKYLVIEIIAQQMDLFQLYIGRK